VVLDDEEDELVPDGDVVVELEPGLLELVVVVDELEGVVVVLVVDDELEPALDGVQDPDTSLVPGGMGTCEGVVPGGRSLMVSVWVLPPSSGSTVTVQESASADAVPNARIAASVAASASTPISLGR
jgi:hypothetical protein